MVNKKLLFIRFCRFSIVGTLNTLLHLLLFTAFFSMQIHYLICQTLAFIVVNLVTFWINRTWTFGSRDPAVGEQILLYYLTRSSTLGITLVQTIVLVEWCGLSPYIGQLTAVAINVFFNFVFSQIFVFKPIPKSLEHYLYYAYVDLGQLKGRQTTVFYIVPVFREHHRLYPASPENPNGEDFVRVKVEQLEALQNNTSEFQWRMIFIDDGDHKHHSGKLVQERIEDLYPEKAESGQLQVWFLETLAPDLAAESRKGGAVITALRHLEKLTPQPSDIVIYTDADISSDLRLSGSLIAPIINGKDLCLSSRWHEDATVMNRGVKQKISSWLYNLMVFALLQLDFADTQNGFKAIRYETVKQILPYLRETGFAFDTEILMLAQMFGRKIKEIPIFWKDSAAESNVSMLVDPLKAVGGLMRQRKYRHQLLQGHPHFNPGTNTNVVGRKDAVVS